MESLVESKDQAVGVHAACAVDGEGVKERFLAKYGAWFVKPCLANVTEATPLLPSVWKAVDSADEQFSSAVLSLAFCKCFS